MYLLDNYDFLEPLVIDGFCENSIFRKDLLALADKPINPDSVYVFRFEDGVIWADYAYTRKKNKSFLKFHKEVENFISSFNMPVYRIGKNRDFKNHSKPVGKLENEIVYQMLSIKECKNG